MKGESNLAGRSPLRLATFSLPTHREVVAVVLSDYRFGLAPRPSPAPVRSIPRVCIPRRRELIRHLGIDVTERLNIPVPPLV